MRTLNLSLNVRGQIRPQTLMLRSGPGFRAERGPLVPKGGNWLKALLFTLATPRWAAVALALALLFGWGLGRITTSPTAGLSETRVAATVTGEVIDMACYFDDGGSGPDHAACARMCIASGLPVGLKTKNGEIYVLIGKQVPPSPEPAAKHESLNAQLAPYAAKIVTISGTIVSKRGMNVIENAQLIGEQALWEGSPKRENPASQGPHGAFALASNQS